ncbi:class I SAM-dependent methyltransferase [Fibrella forsythiae]|uniref:Class I SAM-dependent methyltransferase n=1 Tax=Fibrella forsythiae TaxID=2817061 RepID=A0ABS3JJ81_9BACT|nr:class I SAM-dependent methyltransferase [Fibrella forsythiae]MBO0949483.1 class I SAM-dependent methyltransferase [Fibrella forsythiae]
MRTNFLCALLISLAACNRPQSANQTTAKVDSTPLQTQQTSVYTTKTPAYDGIGQVYLGREISQVMGHLGAEWLERPERQQEERTDLLLAALDLKPTDVVADIGAGTGYFSFRLARAVPQGKVLAVDIQPEMIEYLNNGRKKENVPNVEPILGTITDPKLPANSVDLALMVDAYHEFSNPREMGIALVRSLKPGGRIVLVEYRAEDPNVPIKEHHKMSEAQATREMNALGLKLIKNDSRLPQQHVLIFGKK